MNLKIGLNLEMNQNSEMKPDPYAITRRIDWIRDRLVKNQPVNSTWIIVEFGVDIRTAARYMKYVKEYYDGRLAWNYYNKSFYLR